MSNRLILLSGNTRREGWKTLDVRGSVDFVCKLPGFPATVHRTVWEEIELVHGITQFYPWEAETILREIRQMLAPDGLLVLEQPDIRKVMDSRRVDWIFGDPLWKDPFHMVKWGYSPDSLAFLLRECGFTRTCSKTAKYHVPARDFRIEARP